MLLVAVDSGRRRTPPAGRNIGLSTKGLAVGGEVHATGVDEVFINPKTGVPSMFDLADFGEISGHHSPFGAPIG